MAKPKERHPAEFVRMPASDEQLLGLWARVERGQARRARARQLRRGAAGGALVAVLLGALALTWTADPAPVAGGAGIEAGPGAAGTGGVAGPSHPGSVSEPSDAPRELALADGSHLSLAAGARARVLVMRSDEVRVRLDRGEVDCDVEPARERRFVVEAGAFEVVVTGTRFRVTAGGDGALASSVAVGVERGSVEVREPSGRLLAALAAGQRWSSDRPPAERVAPADAGAPPSPSRASPSRASPSRAAPSRAAPTTSGAPRAESRPVPDALLARASEARQAGKLTEAAAALAELLRKYPTDERAGYAAFLLGRIQLDGLGDPRAAVEAFGFAVAHPGSGFFTEDAAARQIEALARAGQMSECARARDQFLAKYPSAARAASVRGACHAK